MSADARVEAIATVIRDEFAMMQDPDEKHWEQWTREANRIIAADPLTAEHAKLKAALRTLADAADRVGIEHFDTDDMSDTVEEMQTATLEARALLSRLGGGG